MFKKLLPALALAFSASFTSLSASASCPNLSGVYEASYTVLGQSYHVVSTVTQQGCQSMKAENVITGPHGNQGYTREWIADGVFRRKDTATVENAVFTQAGLLTTEVRSPLAGDMTPVTPYFSRRDLVSLDAGKNMVNSEERFDEQGNRVGADRFLYQRTQSSGVSSGR